LWLPPILVIGLAVVFVCGFGAEIVLHCLLIALVAVALGVIGPWKEFSGPDAPKLDFVFTVCDNAAKEVCPAWPGQPMTAHWGLPDPAKAEGTEAERNFAFADTLRMLTNRIGIFVSLPLEKLSKLSLQKHLDDIGKVTTEAVTT
jgi:hypothetical protein